MSAQTHTGTSRRADTRRRRVVLATLVAAFAVLWVGGVASQWATAAGASAHGLGALFLLLAGLIVLLGADTRRDRTALALVALTGFAVEVLGAHTGFPFGRYAYTQALQPQLFGVPVVMSLAWMALVAYAADLAGRLHLPAWPAAVAAALWTTATDLVIDPLATTRFGYWTWAHGGSYYGIPFVNFVGWFATGLLACRIMGARPRPNFWASFVGTAIVLFFALVALANSLLPVALIGFGLCAAGLFVAGRGEVMRLRPHP